MRMNRASTPAATAPPAAGTHEIVAHSLARDRARGWAALVVCACIVVVAGWGALEVEHPAPLLAILGAVPLFAYGWEAISNVTEERHRVYGREVQDQRDYNNDGIIGDPVGHIVTVQGKPAFTLPDLDAVSRGPAPIRPLTGFRISPNDVLFVLAEAPKRGLAFRAWEGTVLPSKIKLDRDGVNALHEGLLTWGFAVARQTTTGRRVELSQAESIDDMMKRVQKGAGSTT